MLSRRAFGFLALPVLPDKPRSAGITVAIDRGLHLRDAILLADNRPGYVDAVKLGWGTSAIVPEGTLRDKIGAYRAKDIGVMPGGTLMEIAAVEGVYERFLDACESGTCGIYNGDGIVKADIIDLLAREIGPERFIYEAPQKRQQVEMIRRFGNEVNLGNIQPDDVGPRR